MSDCNACFYSYGADCMPDFHTERVVCARKEHKCGECGEAIAAGEKYERSSGKWDGELSVFCTCLPCAEIRDTFACEGFVYENLWEDIRESMFETMTTGCLQKLKTARAKQMLLDQWNEWKGLQDA